MIEFREPTLQETEPRAAVAELQRYLWQLHDELTAAMTVIDGSVKVVQQESAQAVDAAKKVPSPGSTFARIKDLIIKSADIVEVYGEKIGKQLEGKYLAISDFGVFQQATLADLQATSTSISQLYTNVQAIQSNIEGIEDMMLETNSYIRTGLMYEDAEGVPRYGVEIGEQVLWNGVTSFRKFARLASDRLSFFDQNGTEIAYISDEKLHIVQAEVQTLTAESISTKAFNMDPYAWVVGSDGHLTLV